MARRKGPKEVWVTAQPSGLKVKVVNCTPDLIELEEQSVQYLQAALDAIPKDSIARSHIENAMAEMRRGPGRPSTRDDVLRYEQAHGMEATMRKFNITAGTIERYKREAKNGRG